MTKLEELKLKHKSIQADMLKESKSAFSEATKDIFGKFPKLKSFSWSQYTPYWNDGDTCEFSANTDSMDLAWDGKAIEEASYSEDVDADPAMSQCLKNIKAMFKSLPEDMLEEMFGDHVKVTASREKFTVDEYEHD